MRYLLMLLLLIVLIVWLGIENSEKPHNSFSVEQLPLVDVNVDVKNSSFKKTSVEYYIDKYGRANQEDTQVRRVYQVFEKISLVADKRHHREPKLLVFIATLLAALRLFSFIATLQAARHDIAPHLALSFELESISLRKSNNTYTHHS